MTVVPFDPSRRRAASPAPTRHRPIRVNVQAAPGGDGRADRTDDRQTDARADARREAETALAAAEERIAALERALIAALRENAQNWARAEHAEAALEGLTGNRKTQAPPN